MAEREGNMRGHEQLARFGQLPQETPPDADRSLGVMVESVVPVGPIEMIMEDGIAEEAHPLTAGGYADNAVAGGVAAGSTDENARCQLDLILEEPELTAVLGQEARRD